MVLHWCEHDGGVPIHVCQDPDQPTKTIPNQPIGKESTTSVVPCSHLV